MDKAKPSYKQALHAERLRLLKEIFCRIGLAYDNLPDYKSVHYGSAVALIRNGKYHNLVDLSCIYDTIIAVCGQATPKLERNMPIPEKQVKTLAEEANTYLDGIPYRYQIYMPLPTEDSTVLAQKINKQLSLVTVGKSLAEKYKNANIIPEPADELDPRTSSLRILLGDLMKTRIPVPIEGRSYITIAVTGYAQSGTLTVFEDDPMYLYKVFFALAYSMNNLKKKNVSASQVYGAPDLFSFYAYKDDYEYATTLNRPADEAKILNAYELSASIPDIDNLLKIFKSLVIKQTEPPVERLRAQIINSLFWYFETLKTENHNLKTVFFTSVLDSFFATGQSKELKAATIARETTDSVQAEELITSEVKALYDDRNHIIHSEIALIDYEANDKRRIAASRARVEVTIKQAYNKFLTAQINRYIKSAS